MVYPYFILPNKLSTHGGRDGGRVVQYAAQKTKPKYEAYCRASHGLHTTYLGKARLLFFRAGQYVGECNYPAQNCDFWRLPRLHGPRVSERTPGVDLIARLLLYSVDRVPGKPVGAPVITDNRLGLVESPQTCVTRPLHRQSPSKTSQPPMCSAGLNALCPVVPKLRGPGAIGATAGYAFEAECTSTIDSHVMC